ncbi:MAG: hypothetical protein HPY76_14450, partial [Anaerolineae bacterium]|nr:hypothetical protein [Anaerolineae bacterium]
LILPEKNRKDLVDVPKKAREDLNIILVTNMEQVLAIAIEPPLKQQARAQRIHKKGTQKDKATDIKKDDVVSDQSGL